MVGVIRGEKLLIAHSDVIVEPNDHLIVFLLDKRDLPRRGRVSRRGHRSDAVPLPRRYLDQKALGAPALTSLFPLPALLLALVLGEDTARPSADAGGRRAGRVLWWPVRTVRYDLRLRDGFLIARLDAGQHGGDAAVCLGCRSFPSPGRVRGGA